MGFGFVGGVMGEFVGCVMVGEVVEIIELVYGLIFEVDEIFVDVVDMVFEGVVFDFGID